jgi:hypothetical protein
MIRAKSPILNGNNTDLDLAAEGAFIKKARRRDLHACGPMVTTSMVVVRNPRSCSQRFSAIAM